MNFTAPKFKLNSFHCPLCKTFSHMHWRSLSNNGKQTLYHESTCSCCQKPSLWRVTQFRESGLGRNDQDAELIYPDFGITTLPAEDMPNDVKADYVEAAKIYTKSPRGAAALLRLGLQKLCKHLGEDGKNINKDIRNLAEKSILPDKVIKVADTVRITGNNAVHPGQMSDDDFDHVSSKLFDLLNFIVNKGITEPKELQALYERTPEAPRLAAEAKDSQTSN